MVFGIENEPIQCYSLAEPFLSLDKTIKIAMESADCNTKDLQKP